MKTTDPQDEIFDVVDRNDVVIGEATRFQVHHEKSLIHRSITVLVFSNGRLLLQKRSMTKDTYPGYWTSSCTGHVLKGQTYKEAALRELEEELGIIADTDEISFLLKDIIYYPHETEYMITYKLNTNQVVKKNKAEIAEYKYFETDNKFFTDILPTIKITPDLEYVISNYFRKDYGEKKIKNRDNTSKDIIYTVGGINTVSYLRHS